MADTSDVDDLDPFDLLDAESERVARFFTSDPDWNASTRCEGWNVRDLLGHVAGVETYHLACLDDSIPALFEEAGKHGVTDMNSFNDWAVKVRAQRSTEEVLDEWRTKNGDMRRRMRDLGRDGSMSSSVGPYPVGLMAFHVASEYATHADDMNVEIPESERTARTAWRAKVSLFGVKETDKAVSVERRDNGYAIDTGDRKSILREDEFVEAVSGRLPADFAIDPSVRDALRALA